MSKRVIDLDVGLLDNSTLGIFVENSAKAVKEVMSVLDKMQEAVK